MYSGEEIEMEENFDKNRKSDQPVVLYSNGGETEEPSCKKYSTYDSIDNKNTPLTSTEADVKIKSSDEEDETCMSSLALMDDSNEPISTSNKKDTNFDHHSARNSICLTTASHGNFKMKTSQIPLCQDIQYQTNSLINSPLLFQDENTNKLKDFGPESNHKTNQAYAEPNWYCNPPPPQPPPFRPGVPLLMKNCRSRLDKKYFIYFFIKDHFNFMIIL